MATVNGKPFRKSKFNRDSIIPVRLSSAKWDKPNMPKKPGCIYFILAGETGRLKIGYCKLGGHQERRANLQTGCPDLLKVLGIIEDKTMGDEAYLHDKFKAYHIHGEWFKFSQEILDYMKQNARRV